MGKKSAVPATDASVVLYINPKTLRPHPLIAELPLLAPSNPQYVALLNSIRQGRILDPIKINDNNQVLDGRHRLQVALDLSLDQVPCLIYPDHEADMIAFETLMARKHYSKGARAYMLVMNFETLFEQSRHRSNSNLKNAKTPRISRQTQNSAFDAKRVSDLARERGLSPDLLTQARKLLQAFMEKPDLKTIWEPRLLEDEIGLGRLLEGIGSSLATTGKKRKLKDFKIVFETARGNIRYFVQRATELNQGELLSCAAELGDEIAKLPADAVKTVAKRLTGK